MDGALLLAQALSELDDEQRQELHADTRDGYGVELPYFAVPFEEALIAGPGLLAPVAPAAYEAPSDLKIAEALIACWGVAPTTLEEAREMVTPPPEEE